MELLFGFVVPFWKQGYFDVEARIEDQWHNLFTNRRDRQEEEAIELGNGIYPIICLDVMPLSNQRGVSLWREYSFRTIA